MRIVSLIPSATEIVAGLLDDPRSLVGVTHECDEPAWVKDRTVVVRPFDPTILHATSAEVDRQVASAGASGQPLYTIDDEALGRLAPDVVVTQKLCDVCAVSPTQLQRSLAHLASAPTVVELEPARLEDVLADIERVGQAINAGESARRWRQQLADRLDAVRQRPPLPTPTSVLVLEWPDPLWSAGHWVPEMVSLAGGHPLAGLAGQPSTRLTEREFEEHSPDVVIVAGCGYDLDRNIQEGRRIADRWAWRGDIFAVDANAFFSRPGPRLLDGVELLANLLRGVPVDEKAARRLTP